MKREYKLPEVLYKLLAEHKMTQQQLADEIHYGQNTIFSWLRVGRMPNLEAVMMMAELFNVTIDYLVYGEDNDG